VERKETGQDWYPPGHFRPLVDWSLDEKELQELESWILGPLFQMTSLLLHEKRAHPSHLNATGELCAQFRSGVLALARRQGPEGPVRTVEAYHKLHPAAAKAAWHPEAFDGMGEPGWQQLYVNAEHDGKVGVLTISRESYNSDVDAELNRAIDWLRKQGIERVILTGDFHLSTQMVGADTSEFFPALGDTDKGIAISGAWSRTARRLNDDFRVSVGYVAGKRALGGMLELLVHCHYLVCQEGAELGFPEVTLPVVPGMEGCHWPFRKARREDWPRILQLLLGGRPVRAKEAVGWLADFAGGAEETLRTAWKIATDGDHGLARRKPQEAALSGLPREAPGLPQAGSPETEEARKAILESVQACCAASLADALPLQSRHSAAFMRTSQCRGGRIGGEYAKTMAV
jgi:enoyl-CoA hydratase/carnithine racemase